MFTTKCIMEVFRWLTKLCKGIPCLQRMYKLQVFLRSPDPCQGARCKRAHLRPYAGHLQSWQLCFPPTLTLINLAESAMICDLIGSGCKIGLMLFRMGTYVAISPSLHI